jgi:hypothetical protein
VSIFNEKLQYEEQSGYFKFYLKKLSPHIRLKLTDNYMQHTQLMKSIISNCSHTAAQHGHDQQAEHGITVPTHYSMQNATYNFSFQNLTKLLLDAL